MTEPLHWNVSIHSGACFYLGRELIFQARKDYQLVQIAKDCLMGKLVIPCAPDPLEVYDQPQLLDIASRCAAVARDMMRG